MYNVIKWTTKRNLAEGVVKTKDYGNINFTVKRLKGHICFRCYMGASYVGPASTVEEGIELCKKYFRELKLL